MDNDNAQEGHTKFQLISERYFPKYFIKKRCDDKAPGCLSNALIKYINHQNKLCKKYRICCSAKAETEYREYKAKSKSFHKSAENKHYQELFLKYKGNLHRTWSMIN